MPLTPQERRKRAWKRVGKKALSHATTAAVALSLAGNALQRRQIERLSGQSGAQSQQLRKLAEQNSALTIQLSETNRRASEAIPLAQAWTASQSHLERSIDLTRDARDLTAIARRRFLTEAELLRAGLVIGGLHATHGLLTNSPGDEAKQKASRVKEAVRKLVAELEAKGHMRLVRRNLPPDFGL